jgi:hypothetical protein
LENKQQAAFWAKFAQNAACTGSLHEPASTPNATNTNIGSENSDLASPNLRFGMQNVLIIRRLN